MSRQDSSAQDDGSSADYRSTTPLGPPPSYDSVVRRGGDEEEAETGDQSSVDETRRMLIAAWNKPDDLDSSLSSAATLELPAATGASAAPLRLSRESIPFADDSDDDRKGVGNSAAAARRSLAKCDDPKKVEPLQAKLRNDIQNIRNENTDPSNVEEIELMIVGDGGRESPRDRSDSPAEETTSLRRRRTGRKSDDEDSDLDSIDSRDGAGDGSRRINGQTNAVPVVRRTSLYRDDASLETGSQDEPEIPDCPHPILTYLVTKWLKMSTSKRLITVGLTLLILGLLLFIILFPASFVYVEYHEYAISRNKWTYVEDFSVIYESGCYLLAPQYEMVRFPATAHQVSMSLAIMNKESLSIRLDITLQYFLKREEIVDLYRRYHMGYDRIIKNIIESTVKNTAISFTMDDFRLRRKNVEEDIFTALKLALSGNCCLPCCTSACSARNNITCHSCDRDPTTCYKGHHIELRYFQMGQLSIPDDVTNRYMRWSILQIEHEREYFIQEKAVVDKNTTLQVQRLLNQAKELREAAKAQSRLILANAEASSNAVIQRSYQSALTRMFKELNVTKEDNKLSFIYMRALEKNRHNLLAFDYDSQTIWSP